jgi:hypothetical protein
LLVQRVRAYISAVLSFRSPSRQVELHPLELRFMLCLVSITCIPKHCCVLHSQILAMNTTETPLRPTGGSTRTPTLAIAKVGAFRASAPVNLGVD